jgi:ribosomal protein S18 acetylase RimI-like enzyme
MKINLEDYDNLMRLHGSKRDILPKESFPYSQLYMNNNKYKNADWDTFYDDRCDLPVALVILKDDDTIDNSLHISCLEVAKQIRHLGFGKKVIKDILDMASKCNYKYVTLKLADPSLRSFYKNLGFSDYDDGMFIEV